MAGSFNIAAALRTLKPRSLADNFRFLRVDPSSHALLRMSQQHHKVHEGESFWLFYSVTLANGETGRLALTIPTSTTKFHIVGDVRSTGTGTFNLYEGLTSYSGGTALTSYNRDRNSTNTSLVTSPVGGKTGATAITPVGGTIIFTEVIASGSGARFERNQGEELILKNNTKYMWEVVNAAGVNNTIALLVEWYEHIPFDTAGD